MITIYNKSTTNITRAEKISIPLKSGITGLPSVSAPFQYGAEALAGTTMEGVKTGQIEL